MINLEELVIKSGDLVRKINEPDSEGFIVHTTKIIDMVQYIYPEFGDPVKASDLILIDKNLSISEKNRITLISILNRQFPNRWEFKDRTGLNQGLNINIGEQVLIIHYPEITIKNSARGSHLIRDLYVAIIFNSLYKISSTYIYGFRSSATEDEIASSYAHSHLSSSPFNNFSSFCTGVGPINDSLVYGRSKDPSVDPLHYEMLFENLTSFVSWESLEGGPYRRMSNIGQTSGYGTRYSYTTTVVNNDIKTLIKNGFNIPIKLNSNVGIDIHNFIDIDDTFNQSMKDFVIREFVDGKIDGNIFKRIIVVKNNNYQYSININNNVLLSMLKRYLNKEEENKDKDKEDSFTEVDKSSLLFRGERIVYKSYKSALHSKFNYDLYEINDTFISQIKNVIKRKFYDEYINKGNQFINSLTSIS